MSDLLFALMAVLLLAWLLGIAYRLGREDGAIEERIACLEDKTKEGA